MLPAVPRGHQGENLIAVIKKKGIMIGPDCEQDAHLIDGRRNHLEEGKCYEGRLDLCESEGLKEARGGPHEGEERKVGEDDALL